MLKLSRLFFLMLALIFLFVGCAQVTTSDLNDQKTGSELKQGDINEDEQMIDDIESDQDETVVEEQSKSLTDEALLELGVNELGQVMVLMYHVIGLQEGEWARTRENFRNDLKRLYDLGYRTVTMTDFVTGQIDIPAGTTPIILTFDDGTSGQFRFVEENDELLVDPDSAVGIILEFANEYPDFGTAATFYINFPNPFGQPKYWQQKLDFLVANGMEIGNHSYSHANLGGLNDIEVQRELAQAVQEIQQVIPEYPVNSLALPFGVSAKNQILELAGEYEGLMYDHLAVLRVGANPSYPLGHNKFNPSRVPRVRADQNELDKWLIYFENNPQLKYVSDGNKDTLVVPVREEENISQGELNHKELIIYHDDKL